MCVIPQLTDTWLKHQLQSAAALYLSPVMGFELTPTELALSRGVARSTVYRQGWALASQLLEFPALEEKCKQLEAENARLQQKLAELQMLSPSPKEGIPVFVTAERIALTVLEMTARKFSTEDIKATLRVAFSPLEPPSDGTINAIVKRASELAEKLQDIAPNLYPLLALELDELFHANSPILMMVEPYSMAIYLLEQLGDAKAHTWKFAMDYRGIEPPFLMVHDCSAQGNALVKRLVLHSQLCVFHRLREIRRELQGHLKKAYEKALDACDERLWELAEQLEKMLAGLVQSTSLLDHRRGQVRRCKPAREEFLSLHQETLECLDMLEQAAGQGNWNVPSLRDWDVREEKFFHHLKRWELLAEEVEFEEGSSSHGFVLLDALAAVHVGARALEAASEKSEPEYWKQQQDYLEACEILRKIQARCKNAGTIAKTFELWVEYEVRTTSHIEAVNRRLRGFTDAKRQVTDRQLRLMQLHHNTTPFTADAKRAGKSPWQWLGLDIPGLEEGFVGVLREANKGQTWPSTWELKANF